jgi:hypothetical protein
MKRHYEEPERPCRRDDLELIRAGRDGVWWQARDGMRIRLAAPEQQPVVERARLSVVAVLLAMIASGRGRPRPCKNGCKYGELNEDGTPDRGASSFRRLGRVNVQLLSLGGV